MTTLISDDVIEIISSDDDAEDVGNNATSFQASAITREVCVVRPYTTPVPESDSLLPKNGRHFQSRFVATLVDALSVSNPLLGGYLFLNHFGMYE